MDDAGLTEVEIKLVAELYKDLELTASEMGIFLSRARKAKLDPLSGQIIPQIRKSKDEHERWTRKLTLVTSIDALRLIADRTECYAPGQDTQFGDPDAKHKFAPAYAKVFVKKFAGEVWHEYSGQAFFAEYVQTKRSGGVSPMWERMPRNQLAKCAEALALRRGFPNELQGLYAFEEMGQAETPKRTRIAEPIPPNPDLPTIPEKLAYADKLKEYSKHVNRDILHAKLRSMMHVGDLKQATRAQWLETLALLDANLQSGLLLQFVEGQ